MSGPTLFIHVGPGKTGTTFLQQEVLPQIHSAKCLSKPTVKFGGEKIRFGDLFNFPLEVWEDSGGQAFATLVENKADRSLVISDEHVFGGLASPQPWIPDPTQQVGPIVRMCRQTNGKTDTYSMAAHLRKLSSVASKWGFARTKVIGVTRRQDTRLASGYAQVSDRVKGAGQESFETWVRYLTQNPIGYYLGGGLKLDYFSWYQEIGKAVGHNSVGLLPFELLKENQSEFVRRFLSLLEVESGGIDRIVGTVEQSGDQKRNASSKSRSHWRLREPVRSEPKFGLGWLLNRLGLPARLPRRWLESAREQEISLTPGLRKEVLSMYEQRNRQLDKKVPKLNISKYGYY